MAETQQLASGGTASTAKFGGNSLMDTSFDLKVRAHRAMVEAGFRPDLPGEVIREVLALRESAAVAEPLISDGRSLLWSSIDNDSSRDLDQVEFVETLPDGSLKLLVGVADVDSRVIKGSAIDSQAGVESTSVYTGVKTFPMLPNELSTDLTSLVDGQDRLALVIELHILDSGEVSYQDVYRSWIRNRAKLAYSSTGAWLEGRGPMPVAVSGVAELEAQLRLQAETAARLRRMRKQHGSLTFGSIEATTVLEKDEVKDLVINRHNQAEDIIESFMVAANVAMAKYLKKAGSWSIRRVVKTPKRWDRIQAIAIQFGSQLPSVPDPLALSQFLDKRKAADPAHFPDLSLSVVKLLGPGEYVAEAAGGQSQGHFGLAVNDYTHSTAPNRRYADLVTQRLLKAAAKGSAAPYSEMELSAIAARCTEREDAARKVERLMRKVIAANILSHRIGEVFDAIVTGASPKGTYVRLSEFPAEGRVIQGAQGIDVGDCVRVRLASVDVDKGFIDFDRVG